MKIFKYEEYTIAQDSKRDFTIVEKNNNFFKLDNATFDSCLLYTSDAADEL